LQKLLLKNTKNFFHKESSAGTGSDKERYEQLVKKSIDQIEEGTFEKIVPSRSKRVDLPESFDAIETFQKLCDTYPNAMISFISIPAVGTWIGASPELLIQVENNHIFKTVALAGTKPFEPGTNIKNVAWTQKEIEEQALVCRYIISNFKKIRLREYDEQGPKTIIAGNVMHLKTTYAVDMKETNFPQLGSVMLQLIHPTSAVCGMPLEESLTFLKENEGYDREFYSGYLGPVNINNTINLFVNLRCMQLTWKSGDTVCRCGCYSRFRSRKRMGRNRDQAQYTFESYSRVSLQPIYDIAEICARKKVSHAVLCPGSRCAPLTIAFSRHDKIKTRTFSDERSAGFIALGIAQQSGNPVVMVCTSGSAAYNFAPSVAEAFFAQTPLLILRPIGQPNGLPSMTAKPFIRKIYSASM
jgi:hypothetical protein